MFSQLSNYFAAQISTHKMINKIFRFSLFAFLLAVQVAFAQNAPHNWFLLDPTTDSYKGTAANAAYDKLLQGKTGTQIIVAVIDGGADVNHPDLSADIWTNEKEIPGNGIDDDKNGYVDDIHGWDFIGGKDGNDVNQDNLEVTRVYRNLKKKYANGNSTGNNTEYEYYLKIQKEFTAKYDDAKQNFDFFNNICTAADDIKKELGKDKLSADDLQNYTSTDQKKLYAAIVIKSYAKSTGTTDYESVVSDLNEGKKQYESMVNYGLNVDFDPRNIVVDNYDDVNEKGYGNNDYQGPDGLHGTHVSGIIAAIRNNNLGIDGVANNVKIMVIRCVPDGDERDKDVANAIRYAADNGAKIINMSFGKGFGYNKIAVDEAVKYAVSKDVLLVHAAGNDAKSNDNTDNFPNDKYTDGSGYAASWVEVGASGPDGTAASFSNYGKKGVDIFSPGEEIYSTVPNGEYKIEQGTSMASPVCAGVAAIIRSYFPNLTAVQVKEILMSSVYKPTGKTPIPGSEKKTAKLKKLCVSGGIVDAYNAVQSAMNMSK